MQSLDRLERQRHSRSLSLVFTSDVGQCTPILQLLNTLLVSWVLMASNYWTASVRSGSLVSIFRSWTMTYCRQETIQSSNRWGRCLTDLGANQTCAQAMQEFIFSAAHFSNSFESQCCAQFLRVPLTARRWRVALGRCKLHRAPLHLCDKYVTWCQLNIRSLTGAGADSQRNSRQEYVEPVTAYTITRIQIIYCTYIFDAYNNAAVDMWSSPGSRDS